MLTSDCRTGSNSQFIPTLHEYLALQPIIRVSKGSSLTFVETGVLPSLTGAKLEMLFMLARLLKIATWIEGEITRYYYVP
jgi:hypothetical protein